MLMVLFVGIGQMWAEEVKLVSEGTAAISKIAGSGTAPAYLGTIADPVVYKSADESYSVTISTSFSVSEGSEYKPDGSTKYKDYYYNVNAACDMSADQPTNYIKVAASNCKISKIVVRAECFNSSVSCLTAAGFVSGLPEKTTLGTKYGRIADIIIDDQSGKYNSSKKFEYAATLTYTFSTNVTEVYFSKQIKLIGTSTSESFASYPSSSQSSGVFGIDVYVVPDAPATNYTITYDANGGTGTMENSTNIVADNGFTYDGKDFVEWNTKSDGTGDGYDPGDVAASDLDLFAIWQTHVAKYTLIYKVDGVEVDRETVNVSGTPAGIADPTKDCYTFAGWSPALDVVSGTDGAEVYVDATWTPRYASSFDFGATTDLTKSNIVSKLDAVNIACTVGTGGSYDDGATNGYRGYKFKNKNDKVVFLLKQGWQATITYGYTQSGWTVNGTDAGVATATQAYVDKVYTATSGDVLYTLVNQSADSKTSVLTKIVISQLYDATYSDETGDASGSAENVAEVTLPTPSETTVGGYSFTGWIANQVVYDGETPKTAGEALNAGGTYTLTANTTFTAQWALIADFDVKFFQGYGDPDVQIGTTQSISTGNYATAPDDPTRTGYVFLGWSTDGTEANIVDVATYGITAATNFTAMWKAVWTVTFDGAGSVEVQDGETVASQDSPTQAGKIFQGWYNGENKYDFSAAVTGNLALTSKWAVANPNHFYYKYNDDFHFDGVVYKTPDGKTKDPEAAEASNVGLATNPYILFSGAEGITSIIATNGIYDYKKGAGTKHITAYLKLKADDATSNVVFTIASGYTAVLKLKMNGYSSNATISLKKGDDAVTPSGTQEGTAEDKNYGELTYNLAAGEYKLTTANKTLYISHIDLEATALPTYTVTYKAGEGTGADVEDADATNVADVPSTFTAPTGKVFNGWKDETNADVEVGTIVSSNMTLTAQWINHYAVTFTMNGHGDAPAEQDIKHGEKATKPADPFESGWIFGGWYKENTCTNAWDFDNDVVTEDTELFAKWTEDPCPDSEKKSIVKVVLTSASDGTVTGYNSNEYAGGFIINNLADDASNTNMYDFGEGEVKGFKLKGSNSAIFATLAKGGFEAGDKVVFAVTQKAGDNKLAVYAAKDKNNVLKLAEIDVADAGIYEYKLKAADIAAIEAAGSDYLSIGTFRGDYNPYIYSVELKGCRSWAVFHTLTFKNIDGTATIAAEPLEEGAAASTVAPAAPKITLKRFLGWAEAIDGTPVDLTTYTIAEDKILYAVYEDIVCPTSGTVYKFEIKDELPSEDLPISTDKDMSSYINATGDAYLTYTATANNKATINTDGTIQMKDASAAYLKVELECALAAGDQIRAHVTNNPIRVQVGTTYDSNKDLILAKNAYEFVAITSDMEDKQVLYITRSSNGNANLADFEIYRRPALTGVTMDDMIVRVNAVANPEMTLTPSNDAIVTAQAWSIVSGSDKITIDPATGAVTGVAAGDAVIKVVLNEDEVNFSATATVHVVNDYTRQDVTGSMKWNWANTGPLSGVAAQEDNNVTETLLANIGTMPNNADFRSDMLVTTCQHAYRTNTGNGCWQGTEIKFYTTVPGAVKVNYMGTGGSDEVTLSINNWSNPYTGSWADSKTIVVPAGWVTIRASESNKLRIKTITFTAAADLDPAEVHDEAYYYGGYDRNVTEGRYGTICLPNGGIMVGAELYEVAYYDGTYEKIFFDEVLNGEMVAGRPYIFLTKEGVNQIAVYYTDEENAPEGDYHGLFGSYTRINLAANDHIYILKDNRYYFVDTDNVFCGANRAYFKMGVAGGISGSYVAPAPGRRRTSIGAGAPAVATGVEDVQGDEVQSTKVLINGHLYIIRGEKMYDAKGQLVK